MARSTNQERFRDISDFVKQCAPARAVEAELFQTYPVILGASCPTMTQVKALGFEQAEAKRLSAKWRYQLAQLEITEWLESYSRRAPSDAECKAAIDSHPGWKPVKVTADLLISKWVRPPLRQKSSISNSDLDAYLDGKEWPGLLIKRSSESGRGVVTGQRFASGTVVCDYRGVLYRAASKSWKDVEDTSYLFCFNVNGESVFIDAIEEDGSIGRLINHSKTKANLKPRSHMRGKEIHLLLYATRDLLPGEELYFNYGDRSKDVPDWYET